MKKIHQLPESLISQIAAGEVIERPAYAVKELIENALDAHATDIKIDIKKSGLEQILITDNGEGMSKEDLLDSFKPHTTSKLKRDDSLLGIKTLGFRGEALSSIASISTMTIRSRADENPIGLEITIVQGKLIREKLLGMPVGTTIIIDQLFHTVPARKKFLKSERTEFRHIIDIVTQYALSYPLIHFTLIHNKKLVFDLPGTTDIIERIKFLLGEHIFTNLLPVSSSEFSCQIHGFIVKPSVTTKQTQKQFTFVNTRRVYDRLILHALKEGFGTLLPFSVYPQSILFLTIPHERLDINIHPRKEYVQFLDKESVFEIVKKAVRKTLEEHNLAVVKSSIDTGFMTGYTDSFAAETLKNIVLPWEIGNLGQINVSGDIMQLHQLYIVLSTKKGIIFIDQHAAHERILYELFLEAFEKESKKKRLPLSKAVNLDLSISDAATLAENKQLMYDLGFTIDNFHESTFTIREVPELFKDRDVSEIVRELLDDITENGSTSLDTKTKQMIGFLACRAAIKDGEKLTKDQMRDLVEQLEKTNNNATCVHGRPTKIVLSLKDIHKWFKRE